VNCVRPCVVIGIVHYSSLAILSHLSHFTSPAIGMTRPLRVDMQSIGNNLQLTVTTKASSVARSLKLSIVELG